VKKLSDAAQQTIRKCQMPGSVRAYRGSTR